MARRPNKFAGVYYKKDSGKWCARVYHRGVQHYVGVFNSEEDASAATKRFKEVLLEREEGYRKEVQHRLRHDAVLLRSLADGNKLLLDI